MTRSAWGLACAISLSGCGSSSEPASDEPPRGGPGPGAFQADYSTSGAFFTRMSQPANSSSVHGTVRIWYSRNIEGFPLTGPFQVPEGTVAIKPEYNNLGEEFIAVIMVKRESGYDASGNDWYYEARLPDGSLATSPEPGPDPLCKGCHVDGRATDYLLGFSIAN